MIPLDDQVQSLEALKAELERFGMDNDAVYEERPRRMLNITGDTGEFLLVLVRATVARRILEIGTSNGYPTLWLAEAAKAIGGSVTTVEHAEYKIGLARANFERSGLAAVIDLVHDDAGRLLERTAEGAYDSACPDWKWRVHGREEVIAGFAGSERILTLHLADDGPLQTRGERPTLSRDGAHYDHLD